MLRCIIIAVVLGCALTPLHAQYLLVAAETALGSQGGNTAAYGGLQQYQFAAAGAAAIPGAGVPAAQLSDPVGMRVFQNRLYVGNRHGNTLGQGSVQQITVTGSVLTAGPTIATASSPSFQGFHGFDFSPANSDLFVSTVNGGSRRYRDSGGGYADIGGISSGAVVRDAVVSPNGALLYESDNGTIRVTPITPGGFGTTTFFNVSGAGGMHQLTLHQGALYAAAFSSNQVFKIDLDASFQPVSSSGVATFTGVLGVAFSPDGQEMYTASHTNNQLGRFLLNSGNWVANGTIATGKNMGYLAVVPIPEPGLLWRSPDLL